ncbi:MAG: hypothetical protein ACON5B_09260 [Myxococcota bacterium]
MISVSELPEGVSACVAHATAAWMPLRSGGPCDVWLVAHGPGSAAAADSWCRDQGLKRTWLGAGTRTAIRDRGVSGAVLTLGRAYQSVETCDDGWRCGAGLPMAVLASRVNAHSVFRNLLFMPGTLGASVMHDVGPGSGWSRLVAGVRVLSRGREVELSLEEARRRRLTVLSVILEDQSVERAVEPVAPAGWWTVDGGSVEEELRRAGLAGTRLRAAALPSSEPNRLVNLGGATARDLEMLQGSIEKRLHELRGVTLEPRVRWLGRKG